MRKSIVYIFIALISSFSFLSAQELNNDYNILHKEPIEGLKLREAWNSKVPVKNITKSWTTWNSFVFQTSEENHSIYSIKKESGVVRWINDKVGFPLKFTPVENTNGFYILGDNVVYVLDPLQGGLMKKISMDHAVAGNVAASQFGLFTWEWGKKLHMIKTDDNFIKGFGHKMDNEMHAYATPTIRQNMVYLPTPEGTLYCYDSRGDKIWEFINIAVFEDMEYYGRAIDSVDQKVSKERQQSAPDLKKIKALREQKEGYLSQIKNTTKRKRGKFLSEPAFYKEFIYVGSTDGSLYALNRFSGNPHWEYQNGEPVIGAIVPISDQVIFFLQEQGAVSIERGVDKTQLKWKIKDAIEVLNVSEKHIYFRTKKNEVLCVDRKYGQEIYRWSIKSNLEVVGSLTDDAIYVIDKTARDGNLTIYALTELGNLPKVEDKESLVDVGYFYYDEIDKAKEAKIKEELDKAEKAKKAAEGKPEEEAGDKKAPKPKAEKKPKEDAPAEKKEAEPKPEDKK
jgi:outer membrane protein assembly factor BamB